MKRYLVINHATETERLVAMSEEEDENEVHRYNKTDKEHIQKMREMANIEVKKIDVQSPS